MKAWIRWKSALWCSLLVQPAAAQQGDAAGAPVAVSPTGLTADEAARRAVETSNDVDARASAERAARADVDRAKSLYFPRLTLTGRYTRLSPIDQPTLGPSNASLVATPSGEGPVPPGTTLVGIPSDALTFPALENQYWLQANVTVPLSDYLLRIGPGVVSADQARQSASLGVRVARHDAALRGRLAYYAWVRARLQQRVAVQSLEQARAHLRRANAASDAGRLPRVDVLRTESQVASAELLVERARQLVAVTEDALRTVLHDDRKRRYEIGEDPLQAPRRVRRGDIERLYAEALAARPEVRAIEHREGALTEQQRAVRAGNLPRLDAFGNAYYANPNPRILPPRQEWVASWDVGLQVTWSPNDLGTAGAEARKIDAQLAELKAQEAALRDAIRGQVVQAYEERATALVALEASERAVATAEEAARARAVLFEQGRASTVELVDAETELLRARLERVDAHVDVLVAEARLDHAVGRDAAALESTARRSGDR